MAAGGHNQYADVVEDTPHEVGEVAAVHRDAWGDSGHVPQGVQGDIHQNRQDMRHRGIAEGGRGYYAVSAVDRGAPSD